MKTKQSQHQGPEVIRTMGQEVNKRDVSEKSAPDLEGRRSGH